MVITLGDLLSYFTPDTLFQIEPEGHLGDLQPSFYIDLINNKTRFNTVATTNQELYPCEVVEIDHTAENSVLFIKIRRP